MSTCAKCGRSHGAKVYSDERCQRCYRRDLRISRGLPVATDLIGRIQSRIEVNEGGCHIFQGTLSGGYGKIAQGSRAEKRDLYVHRVMYEFAHGPIPNGLHIDHLCRMRACCNPAHLEAVTQAENNRRAAAAKSIDPTRAA